MAENPENKTVEVEQPDTTPTEEIRTLEMDQPEIEPTEEIRLDDIESIVADADEHVTAAAVPAAATLAKPKKARRGFAWLVSMLALFVSLAALVGGCFVYWTQVRPLQLLKNDISTIQQQVDSQLSEARAEVDGAVSEFDSSMQSTAKAWEDKLATIEKSSTNQIKQLQDNVSLLRKQNLWGQREWSLAETGYLLQLANDRIIYMRDADTAANAVRSSIEKLEFLSESDLFPLQQQLRADLTALVSYRKPDTNAILNNLEALVIGMRVVPSMAAKQAELDTANTSTDTPTSVEPEQSWLGRTWSKVTGGVQVTTLDEPTDFANNLTVQSKNLETLAIRLESIRIALIRENLVDYRDILADTERWVNNQLGTSVAEPLIRELQTLQANDPFPPLPDLNASINTLNAIIEDGLTRKVTPVTPDPTPQTNQASPSDTSVNQ